MNGWLTQLLGEQSATFTLYLLGGLALLVLIWVAWFWIRRFAGGAFVEGGRQRRNRLAVVDATAVDNKRRVVLVRRDDVEHLVMIGGENDFVIERNIPRPAAEAPQRGQGKERRPREMPARRQAQKDERAARPAPRETGRRPEPADTSAPPRQLRDVPPPQSPPAAPAAAAAVAAPFHLRRESDPAPAPAAHRPEPPAMPEPSVAPEPPVLPEPSAASNRSPAEPIMPVERPAEVARPTFSGAPEAMSEPRQAPAKTHHEEPAERVEPVAERPRTAMFAVRDDTPVSAPEPPQQDIEESAPPITGADRTEPDTVRNEEPEVKAVTEQQEEPVSAESAPEPVSGEPVYRLFAQASSDNPAFAERIAAQEAAAQTGDQPVPGESGPEMSEPNMPVQDLHAQDVPEMMDAPHADEPEPDLPEHSAEPETAAEIPAQTEAEIPVQAEADIPEEPALNAEAQPETAEAVAEPQASDETVAELAAEPEPQAPDEEQEPGEPEEEEAPARNESLEDEMQRLLQQLTSGNR